MIVVALAALAGAQQMPTIRVPVRLVTLPTLVFSRDNRLLGGLKPADFLVLDNGRPQRVTLDTAPAPVSVALAVQANQDVREYLPFIAKVGSAIDALLVGESGEAAVVTYGGEVTVAKPFQGGDIRTALRAMPASGGLARMIDAGMRAVVLLAKRPVPRSRVLLFIGQPMDSGSETRLETLREKAEQENVAVFALALPEVGKAFASDTFSLQGVSRAEKGGFRAGADLGRLVSVLSRSADAESAADPFSVLTSATGGTQLHFRKQRQLEDAIAAIGVELRSAYLLSFYPASEQPGYHAVTIEVNVPGAKVHARPGYWMSAN